MKRGSKELFGILVRDHEPRLSVLVRASLCKRAVGQERAVLNDVNDGVQETFVAAWEHFETYDPDGPFGGRLWGIAPHKIVAYLRRQGTEKRYVRILSLEALEAISDKVAQLLPHRGGCHACRRHAMRIAQQFRAC